MTHDPAPDRGTDGQAALARPHRTVTIGGKQRSSAAPGERIEVRRYSCECHLDRLNARGQLTDRQWAAGMKYRRYWLAAALQPRVSGRYSDEPGGGSLADVSAYRVDARQALDAVAEMLPGPMLMALNAVAGCDETIAGRLRWLQAALDVLADYWEIERVEMGG